MKKHWSYYAIFAHTTPLSHAEPEHRSPNLKFNPQEHCFDCTLPDSTPIVLMFYDKQTFAQACKKDAELKQELIRIDPMATTWAMQGTIVGQEVPPQHLAISTRLSEPKANVHMCGLQFQRQSADGQCETLLIPSQDLTDSNEGLGLHLLYYARSPERDFGVIALAQENFRKEETLWQAGATPGVIVTSTAYTRK